MKQKYGRTIPDDYVSSSKLYASFDSKGETNEGKAIFSWYDKTLNGYYYIAEFDIQDIFQNLGDITTIHSAVITDSNVRSK